MPADPDAQLGNIDRDLLDTLPGQPHTTIFNLAERSYDTSNLQRSALVPKHVDGREVQYTDRLQAQGLKDINDFWDVLERVIQDRLSRDGVARKNWPDISHDFPPNDAFSEVITFCLDSREPASISRGKQMNRRVQEWKPRLRDIQDDPQYPNEKLYILGRSYDNVVELSCWARNAKTADARVQWLEDTVDMYLWYWRYLGFGEIRFLNRLRDKHIEVENNKWHQRTLRFYIRTEKLKVTRTHIIRQLIMNVKVTDGLSPEE